MFVARCRPRWVAVLLLAACSISAARADDPGTVPKDGQGRPLNLDFESGTLRDWTAEGPAFADAVVEGDAVARRRGDMASHHAGRFWVGSYEKVGDPDRGTLSSAPFPLAEPFLSFLLGGGAFPETRAEVVLRDGGRVIAKASGEDVENMARVAFDLTPYVGQDVFIRLVDDHSGGWGHVNFDDVRLHHTRPDVPARRAPDRFAHAGLPPEKAAAAMTVPDGFQVTLYAGEPDVHQPIGFTIDDRGRLWVAESYSYPVRSPEGKARDQIVIFEDTDGDGHFDKRKVFHDRLDLVSGIEVGYGGVWVGAAPHLLFFPDKDGDDKPDGPPQVLLDGWDDEDTHETLNTFTWGPDGWLYGCHGVFTHSRVGRPGTPDAERTPINAGIWRYHPTRHAFEVFAHGTSNPWGIAFDPYGRLIETACVIPHLFHMIQGGRYHRQAGPHFNPYTYDDIKTFADHRHYLGDNPHRGNGSSSDAGGGHAHAGAMIYQGGSWPAPYPGSLFMNNIHGARLNRDVLTPNGSGFTGSHAPDFLLANDSWSQIINLKYGPDGQVYFIDWYDGQQCHTKKPGDHDRTNGRIFRVSYQPAGGPAPKAPIADVAALSDAQLIEQVAAPNEWYAAHARRVLRERAASGRRIDPAPLLARLRDRTGEGTEAADVVRVRALWALHAIGAATPSILLDMTRSGSPHLRAWAIQLAAEGRDLPADLRAIFASLADSDPSPVVRLALASAAQRTNDANRAAIVAGLSRHPEDAADPNLPFMVWYAAEPLAASDPERALAMASASRLPQFLSFTVRRVAALGTPRSLELLVAAIGNAPTTASRLTLLDGVNRALQGRRTVEPPALWPGVLARLQKDAEPEVQARTLTLAATFGDPGAMARMRAVLGDRGQNLPRRREALSALLKARDPGLSAALRGLLADPALRGEALRGLAASDDPATPEAILAAYPNLPPAERRDALNTLLARPGSARALFAAVGSNRVGRGDLSADLVRQARNLKDPAVDAAIAQVWGAARETSADRARVIADARKRVLAPSSLRPDPLLGRAVFGRVCAQCHNLFGTGGAVGPELTGSNRADLDYVLGNVYDPSALIGKDYVAQVVATTDGRVLTGIVRAEDRDALTLVTANETLVLPRGDVESRQPSEASMMPEGLWDNLDDHEVRSLVAYLASPAQVPMLATPDNAAGFANGRDLAGWSGEKAGWTARDGMLIAQPGAGWIRSDLAAADFRLTLEVQVPAGAAPPALLVRGEFPAEGGPRGDAVALGPVGPGRWVACEVTARGDRVEARVDGKPSPVSAVGGNPPRRGVVAIQAPGGAEFRNLRLEVPGAKPAP